MIEKYEVTVEYSGDHPNLTLYSITWKLNGKLHRLDGPAIEYADGTKYWYVNGILHKLDGPAVEWANGNKTYWIEGEKYSYEDWKKKVKELQPLSYEGKVVEIEGKKYKLVEVE